MEDFADLVIMNASVHTMDPAAPHHVSDAIAVKDGRVAALGHNDVSQLIGPATRVIDAAGGAVIPGINDAHLHFVSAAMAAFGYVRLEPAVAPDWAAVVDVVEAAPAGDDGWVRAHGWDEAAAGPGAGIPARRQAGHARGGVRQHRASVASQQGSPEKGRN